MKKKQEPKELRPINLKDGDLVSVTDVETVILVLNVS